MSEKFKINRIIEKLKETRKIFTSEADLQLELALAIKSIYKNAIVRLEYCPVFDNDVSIPDMHIDILVIIDGKWIPIELKYKTKKYAYTDNDLCQYKLKDQSAHDCGCYDYIKDIKRIELIRENKEKFEKGFTIFITNDKVYKNGPRNNSSYVQFSLQDERTIQAGVSLNWKEGKVVSNERKDSIMLNGDYNVHWNDFSKIEIKEHTDKEIFTETFYILINEITK